MTDIRRCSVCGTILSKRNKSKNKCFLHSRLNITIKNIVGFFKEQKEKSHD